jgi:hypothetical protein
LFVDDILGFKSFVSLDVLLVKSLPALLVELLFTEVLEVLVVVVVDNVIFLYFS